MTKDELEQRVNDARARNAEGTCSDDWHKMVEYELRVEIERLREALRKAEIHACSYSADMGFGGKCRELLVCRVCGATLKKWGQGHREDCAFYVREEKHGSIS